MWRLVVVAFEPPKYAFPVVVAPPEMVRPPACVPSPMVVDANDVKPPLNARSVEVASFGNGYAKMSSPV